MSRRFPRPLPLPQPWRLRGATVSVVVGIVMLVIAAALILLARPRKGEDVRPFMNSSLVFAVYPATILVFIAMR